MGMRMIMMVYALLTLSVAAADLKLPVPQKTGGMPLMDALSARHSGRVFSSRPLGDQLLSDLLWAACGVNREGGKRTAPSARNSQEVDIYVALPSGLYLYDAAANRLVQKLPSDIREKTGVQPFTQQAPVNLIYVADYERLPSDQEFYSATDTGFISQNVYLFCASKGLNTVVLGWVEKEVLHEIMQLKPSQHIILTQPVGFLPE